MDLLGGKQEFCSKIELSISCTNLANKDLTSKSDPICVVKQKNSDGKYVEVIWKKDIYYFYNILVFYFV